MPETAPLRLGPRSCRLIDDAEQTVDDITIVIEIKRSLSGAFIGRGLEYSGETIVNDGEDEVRIQAYAPINSSPSVV